MMTGGLPLDYALDLPRKLESSTRMLKEKQSMKFSEASSALQTHTQSRFDTTSPTHESLRGSPLLRRNINEDIKNSFQAKSSLVNKLENKHKSINGNKPKNVLGVSDICRHKSPKFQFQKEAMKTF